MSLKNAFTIIFGKLMVKTLHLLGRDAGNFPGLVLWTINKDCLKAFKVDCPIVAVTGTNGKTSVTNYLSHIFASGGKKIITNPEGNNLDTGICSLLLNHCDMRGRVHADYLVLETDESHVPVVYSKLNLQTLVLLNFFRDQLDRNGEVETLILKVKKFLETFEGNVVLNADDPNVEDLDLLTLITRISTISALTDIRVQRISLMRWARASSVLSAILSLSMTIISIHISASSIVRNAVSAISSLRWR